jgi:hypothetical protein
MYTISIIWYLAWPILITVSTVIIYHAVKKFDSVNKEISES